MNIVNPELDRDPDAPEWPGKRKNDPAFKKAVAELFGRSDNLIVRAVDDFLDKNPGSLDQYGLRTIAAAAPYFGDANQVARMIDLLPITRMNIALAPLDIEHASAQFGHVVPNFSPRTSQKLVMDMVRTSARELIMNSPPERVPPTASKLVTDHLLKEVKGAGPLAISGLLRSPFVSSEVITRSLDRIERFLAGAGAVGGIRCLEHVLDARLSDVITDQDLERAWQLIRDSAATPSKNIHIVLTASANDRLVARHAHSILDLVDAGKGFALTAAYVRGNIVASRAAPEDAVHRALRDSALAQENGRDQRLFRARVRHYKDSNEPFALSAVEIDRALAAGPFENTGAMFWAETIEDRQALEMLVTHVSEMYPEAVASLTRNPNLESSLVAKVLAQTDPTDCWNTKAGELRADIAEMLASPKLTDGQLADLLRRSDVDETGNRAALTVEVALCNVSSGPEVFTVLEEFARSQPRDWLERTLKRVATNTASPHIQTQIARRALDADDRGLIALVMQNGTVRDDLWEELSRRVPPANNEIRTEGLVEPYPDAKLGHYTTTRSYGDEDVLDLIASGRAPRDRPHSLTREWGFNAELTARLLDTGLVGDEKLTSMTESPDIHVALRFATHPSSAEIESRLESPSSMMLEATGVTLASQQAALPDEKDAGSWADLPSTKEVPLPSGPLHPLLKGREVGNLVLEMPRTKRDLDRLADEMGNCIARYSRAIETGTHVLAYMRDRQEIYAAMWEISGSPLLFQLPGVGGDYFSTVRLVELNSKFNENNVPANLRTAITQLTDSINRRELQSVEAEQARTRQVLVRPPRRTPLRLPNSPDRAEDRAALDAAPSILGTPGERVVRLDDSSDMQIADDDTHIDVAKTDAPGHELT